MEYYSFRVGLLLHWSVWYSFSAWINQQTSMIFPNSIRKYDVQQSERSLSSYQLWMTVIIIWHIILCARGCVCVCVCGYGRVYSLTSTSVWFQTFPPFPARVCVCLLRFKIASVSILQDPDCTRPVTLQGQMSCGDGASGLRARDGSLQQGGGDADFHCDISFTRQAFFFFLIQRAWSQVVLRRLSAQTPRAHKLLFDISTWVLFFLFFLKSSLRMWKNCLFFFFRS